MSALDRKLFRDLVRLWGQALAIALVLAAGVATYVLANGAYASLYETRQAYYERYRFADVFATARRAPRWLVEEIEHIPGVMAASARITSLARLEIDGVSHPVNGLVISLPPQGQPVLNRLYVREGRLPDPLRPFEVVINESFALAHGLRPGATLTAILDGRRKRLQVVGIALSPEIIYALGPGDLIPDNARFGIFAIGETAAEAAFDLDGAFNDIALTLMRGVEPQAVIDELDRLLAPYGGTGGFTRKDQQSHAFLDAELQQLKAMSTIIPPIFLAVAAFLINMTLARLIALEREQIGLLKALGYANARVAMHYVKFVSAIAVVGVLIGFAAGVWLGRGLTSLQGEFYHFPFLVFRNPPEVFAAAGAIGLLAAWVGCVQAVFKVLRLSPAVAMAPPAPPRYRRGLTERIGLFRGASQLTLMTFRHVLNTPVRSALTIFGVASAGALLVLSLSSNDSIDKMMDISFFQSSRQDATIIFDNIKPERIVEDVRRLPGILRAEAYRTVPVTLRHGHLSKRVSLQGIRVGADLQQILDRDLRPYTVPEFGLAMSDKLAQILEVGVGDRVRVETMDHRRRAYWMTVTAIQQGYLGLSVHSNLDHLTALLGDGRAVNAVDVSIDEAEEAALYATLRDTPSVSAVMMLRSSLANFRATLARNILISTVIYVSLAVIIVVGVVYNTARVQLSERAREYASLRVLGFTKAEVSSIFLGEIAILVAAAIPLSFGLGYLFTVALISAFETELYRIPIVVGRATYGWTAVVLIAASVLSAVLVRRRIDALDLVAVLKTRE